MALVDDVVQSLKNLGGSAHRTEIYKELKKLTGTDYSGEQSPRQTISKYSSDSVQYRDHRKDYFHRKGGGVWELREDELPTLVPSDIDEPPKRIESKVSRIIRDTAMSKRMKLKHKYKCQICETRLQMADCSYYAEAHHIRPLGGDHKGPDKPENILVLCPNCHALCDFQAIELNIKNLRLVKGHNVSQEYLDYHNDLYKYKNSTQKTKQE